MSGDIAHALDRIAPTPGGAVKLGFTVAASVATAIPFHVTTPLGGFATAQGALYISIRVTAPCHIVFGDLSVADPTNSDALFDVGDGYQDFVLTPSMTHFKVKGDTGNGDVYIIKSGH